MEVADFSPPGLMPAGRATEVEIVGREKRAGRRALIVLGMHRSGTSALTRVLGLCGAALPQRLLAATEANTSGYWEPAAIVALHDEILASAGLSWHDVSEFPHSWFSSDLAPGFRRRLMAALREDYGEAPLFVVKDPRLCRLVPLWLEVLDALGATPLFVIAVRNPLEVAASLKRRDGFPQAKSLLLWLRHFLAVEHDTRGHKRSFVTYEQLLGDWCAVLDKIGRDLDLHWPRRSHTAEFEIESFICEELRHSSFDDEDVYVRRNVMPWVKTALAWAIRAANSQPAAPEELDAVGGALADADAAFGPLVAAAEADIAKLAGETARQIAELENVVAARSSEASAREKQIAERDERIAEFESAVTIRDRKIEARDGQIAELENVVAAHSSEAAARERQIAELAVAAERATQQALADGEAHRDAEARVAAAEAGRLAVTSQLDALEMSTAWRATYPLRRIGHRIPVPVRRQIRRGTRLVWWTVTLQAPRRIRAYRDARRAEPAGRLGLAAAPQAPAAPPRSGPRLRAPQRPRALVIDDRWPRPDRDSGSVDAILQMRALRKFGYEVIVAAVGEFAQQSPYRQRLEAEGFICLSETDCPSIEAFFESDGATLELCLLSRVHWGGNYLERARRHAPGAKIVFNTVDLHHLRETRAAQLAGDAVALRQAQATRDRELYIVRQADATIVVSATEYAVLERLVPGAAVFELPLARPVSAVIPGFAARQGVGFVGGFEHAPNVDAVRYLLDEIWPRVLERLPRARLSIVGAGLPGDLIASTPAGVKYLGPLPDLTEWFDGLRLTVAPLRFGAGAKGKVASSLAAGVPCVGTAIAAEGMRLIAGLHMAVDDTPGGLAARICEVHEDADLWAQLSAGGHEIARRQFSIEAGEERLAALLRTLGLPIPAEVAQSLAAL